MLARKILVGVFLFLLSVPTVKAGFTGFPERVELNPGDSITLSGYFENDFDHNLSEVWFIIKGDLDPRWFEVSPSGYDKIGGKEKKSVELEFNIPPDAEIYTYPIILKAYSDSIHGKYIFSHELILILIERSKIPLTTIPEKPTNLRSFLKSYPIVLIIIFLLLLIIWDLKP